MMLIVMVSACVLISRQDAVQLAAASCFLTIFPGFPRLSASIARQGGAAPAVQIIVAVGNGCQRCDNCGRSLLRRED